MSVPSELQALSSVNPGAEAPHKIVVIDDDPASIELVSEVLKQPGLEIIGATDAPAGLALVKTHRPELILRRRRRAKAQLGPVLASRRPSRTAGFSLGVEPQADADQLAFKSFVLQWITRRKKRVAHDQRPDFLGIMA